MKHSHVTMLPVELYRPIIHQVTSTRDLYSCLFVCKAFKGEAVQGLYHTITIRPLNTDETFITFRHLNNDETADVALVTKLASSPYLSNLVRELYIPYIRLDEAAYVPYWRAVHCALKQMSNLERFCNNNPLFYDQGEYPEKYICLLQDCTFRLRSLIFKSSLAEMQVFIDAQAPHLEELMISLPHSFWPTIDVQYNKLKIVGCVSWILPSMLDVMPNATALEWKVGSPFPAWHRLKPYGRIRSLNILCYWTRDSDLIQQIISCFASLVYLKCTVPRNTTPASSSFWAFNSTAVLIVSTDLYSGSFRLH